MDNRQLLIYALLVVGFALFSFIGQRAAKRAQQQEQQTAQEQQAPHSPEAGLLEHVWGQRSQAALPAAAAPAAATRSVEAIPAAATLPARRRAALSALLRSKQDLRDAIVVMTVLGPCRALQPHESRDARSSP
jgi:hypothetical protein